MLAPSSSDDAPSLADAMLSAGAVAVLEPGVAHLLDVVPRLEVIHSQHEAADTVVAETKSKDGDDGRRRAVVSR